MAAVPMTYPKEDKKGISGCQAPILESNQSNRWLLPTHMRYAVCIGAMFLFSCQRAATSSAVPSSRSLSPYSTVSPAAVKYFSEGLKFSCKKNGGFSPAMRNKKTKRA